MRRSTSDGVGEGSCRDSPLGPGSPSKSGIPPRPPFRAAHSPQALVMMTVLVAAAVIPALTCAPNTSPSWPLRGSPLPTLVASSAPIFSWIRVASSNVRIASGIPYRKVISRWRHLPLKYRRRRQRVVW